MADYVRVMIAIAAQWRVVRAIGPSAQALAGVPVTGPWARPVVRVSIRMAKPKGGSGTGR